MGKSKKGQTLLHTFDEATKDFLTKAKSKLKDSTFSRYTFICERHIIPYFGDIQLSKLNNETINNFIKHKQKCGGLNGGSISPKTINDIVSLLLQIVKSYCKFDLDIGKPTYKQAEISILTETEYNQLKNHLSIGTDSIKLGIIIAMLTGIRIGELCALKWENINLDTEVISIEKTIQRIKIAEHTSNAKTKIIIDTPKSNASVRVIPIPAILLHKLKSFKSHDNSYLLTNSAHHIEPRIYQRHFKNHLKACNINDKKFHALRHTFATMAIARDMDIKTLSILLGHADVGFTMKRYVHPNMEHKRLQIEKLAAGF